MKRNSNKCTHVLTILVLLTALTASGQTEKGRITVGGSSELSFTGGKQDYTFEGEHSGTVRYNEFNFSPYLGYFVLKDLQVSFQVLFKTSKANSSYSNGTTGETRTSSLSVGPSVGYYLPVGEQVRPFVQAGVVYTMNGNGDDANKFSGITLGGLLGGSYFISKQAAVELGLRYSYSALKNKANKDLRLKGNTFAPILGMSFYF